MKIIKKLKKAIIGIWTYLITMPTKILAVEPAYGINDPYREKEALWECIILFIFPVSLLIGIIIYFKKSKSSIIKKIMTLIIILLSIINIILLMSNMNIYLY